MLFSSFFQYLRLHDDTNIVSQWAAMLKYDNQEQIQVLTNFALRVNSSSSSIEIMTQLFSPCLEMLHNIDNPKGSVKHHHSEGLLLALVLRKIFIEYPGAYVDYVIEELSRDEVLVSDFNKAFEDEPEDCWRYRQFCVICKIFMTLNLFPQSKIAKMKTCLRITFGLLEEVPTLYTSGGDESPRTERRMRAYHKITGVPTPKGRRRLSKDTPSFPATADEQSPQGARRRRATDQDELPQQQNKRSKKTTAPHASSRKIQLTAEALQNRPFEPRINNMMPGGSPVMPHQFEWDTMTEDLLYLADLLTIPEEVAAAAEVGRTRKMEEWEEAVDPFLDDALDDFSSFSPSDVVTKLD